MKKSLLFVCLILVVSFSFTANSFAKENGEKTGFIGKFLLGEANWNSVMESQMLEIIGNLPEIISVDLVGHTDETGPDRINIPLAKKRAEVVGEKIKNIKPKATVSTRGIIYNPGNGQDVNYRMVEVIISYNEKLPQSINEESLNPIKLSLDKMQNRQMKIAEKVDEINNTQSIKALEHAVLQFGQDLTNQSQTLNSKLSANQKSIEDIMNDYFGTVKKYLLLQSNNFFDRLQEESKLNIEESERINASIQKMLNSIGEVGKTQKLDAKIFGSQSKDIYSKMEDSKAKFSELSKEIKSLKDDNESMQEYLLYGFFVIVGLIVIQILFFLSSKNKK